MKSIVSVLLLVACAQAMNIRNLKPLRVSSSNIYPKHTGAHWDHTKECQLTKPEVFPGFKKGVKSQPAYAGVTLKSHINSRIAGGQQAEHGQFPWQALVLQDNTYYCGGSLISDKWVLTSAGCVYCYTNFVIVLGAQDSSDDSENGRQVFRTPYAHTHENYNPDTFDNNIAVIDLMHKASRTEYVNMIGLPPRSMQGDYLVGMRATVSGWGRAGDSAPGESKYLNYVTMTVMTNEDCHNRWGDDITSSSLCTDTTGGHSFCSGDVGGPLIVEESIGRYVQVGIASFYATKGCEFGYPSAFTRVTSYLDWIEGHTGTRVRDY